MTNIVPLFAQDSSKPFPFESFPPILRDYAKELCRFVQVADSIVGSSLLSMTSLLVQGRGNVSIDYRSIPLSLSTLVVADSGERKTTVDKIILAPIRKREEDLFSDYPREKGAYALLNVDWQRKLNIYLEQGGSPPHPIGPPPPHPKILMQEPTIEGITKQFEVGYPFLGLFSDEGAKMLGGYSLGGFKEMHSAGHLSNFWDGAPIERTRGAKEEKNTLFNKRLTVCLMIQNIVFERVWNNLFLQEQGLLARFLICQPSPLAGTRFYKTYEASCFEKSQEKVTLRVNDPLDLAVAQHRKAHFMVEEGKTSHDAQETIRLSQEALESYREFNDHIEREIALGGLYYPIKSYAAKTGEQSLRIAACLTLFEIPYEFEISKSAYERGKILAQWYLDETLRISYHSDGEHADQKEQYILDLLSSRWQRKKTGLTLREITHNFPIKKMRKKDELLPILTRLEKSKKIEFKGKVWVPR